jgi:sulfatase modifying factor 1
MAYRSCSFIVLALVATLPVSHAQSSDVESAGRIAGLIDNLGNDSYVVRETAGRELNAIGEPALPPLRLAAKNSDELEIRARAKGLIGQIMETACQSRSTGLKLAMLNAGEFTMGSTLKEPDRRNDEQQHRVKIAQPFLIGVCEVTQDEYRKVMNRQPSWFSPTGEGKEKLKGQPTSRFPVDSVTWYDAIEFCNRLSEQDGMPAYYQLTEIQREGDAIVKARVEVGGGIGYRLPTEAEWEYACRAGTSTPYHFGSGRGGGNFQHMASTSYGSSSRKLGRTTTVGSYKPNAWGLYDMHGNVAEWCWDWYEKGYYSKSPESDPRGPEHGDHRVLRGGSWLVKQSSCRSATRFWHAPNEVKYYVGFRVARNPSRYMTDGREKK